MKYFPEGEYHIPFFDEYGYVRKRCPKCGDFFWTQDPHQEVCMEATGEGCAQYTFIKNPPTRRAYTIHEMREEFLSFFERNGHKRISPYPVVARWRDDLFFTHASIVDFQPYVTEGIAPPPANPLVISQPCLRFVDVDNVGPTFGRHLTIFEMGGAHAFNYPNKRLYWKDQTVRYHHQFVTEILGVKSEEVIYKEGIWSGGGNAGPCVESIVRGLELATLVFMKFKVVDDKFIELPILTVDTGYGIERYTWLSQGSVSGFHAIYGPVMEKILDMAGLKGLDQRLLVRVAELSGLMNLERKETRLKARISVAEEVGVSLDELERMLKPLESAFTVADHTKCLVFMLAEGVVPSNVREGYLPRLMIRRTYRHLSSLSLEDKLFDIIEAQIGYWSDDFPHLKEMREEIREILEVEVEKFKESLRKGRSLIKRITSRLKAEGSSSIPLETLTELYDSHGIPPEIVKETSEKEGVRVEIPDNFYALVAERHIQSSRVGEEEKIRRFEDVPSDIPETRALYYEDPYKREFDAVVVYSTEDGKVILDSTAFYPEGGGQPPDTGYLELKDEAVHVKDVQKIGGVIIHFVEGRVPEKGDKVRGRIDWDRRMSLMRHHTATHILLGAARRILGEHVWQSGAQKGAEKSRIDISHFRRLTEKEVHAIERLANEVVMRNLPVKTAFMPREEAERRYGFRLYQGGVVPGREIRVVSIEGWDVEACGGTHLRSTGEVGLIKIVHTERIQDGVERIVFSAGISAVKSVQNTEVTLRRISEIWNVPLEKVEKAAADLMRESKQLRRERERLMEELAKLEAERLLSKAKTIGGLKLISESINTSDVSRLIKPANQLIKAEPKSVVALFGIEEVVRLVVMVGEEALKRGIDARKLANEAATIVGGRGSGRPYFAQGGGTKIEEVPSAMEKIERLVQSVVR